MISMRNRAAEWIIVFSIFLLIAGLTALGVQKQDSRIMPPKGTALTFTGEDGRYLREHEEVKIFVEEGLQYLIGDQKGGYLQDYLGTVLEPSGLKPVLLTGEEGADCSLRVVTTQLRESVKGENFTSPLFQIEGHLFVRDKQSLADPMQVCVQKDRMTDKKLDKLTYQDKTLSCTGADSAAELVEQAGSTDCDGIIGDSSAIEVALHSKSMDRAFTEVEKDLYTCNACILVKEEQSALYDIMNQCIQNTDRHNLSYEMGRRWMDGRGPVYLEQSASSTYLPVIIVILSVLLAFFVYYLTNRSMYQELGSRMDQITASRNELQTTFRGVSHYMAELTPRGEITDLNQAFAEGVSVSALHRRLWDVLDFAPEDQEKIIAMVEDSARGIQTQRLEAGIGSRVFVIDIFPVEDARGQVSQLLFMAIDVTQERMAKRQMLQDNKMIAVGQLAAGIAHEIRNPLGIIRNYCYVLKNMEDEDIRAKAIEEIENAVEKSGLIISNLLDFSRISPERKETIDVEEHVRAILALNEASMRQKNIVLSVECPQPVRTLMALEPFDMILLNLVSNAMDAVEAKIRDSAEDPEEAAGSVTIRIEADSPGAGQFTMTVEDTGEGISEEEIDEIFNPFFTTKGNQGTGLGLYIVYNELEKLDGDIQVSSRKGEGTAFRVTLPIVSEDKEEGTCPESI